MNPYEILGVPSDATDEEIKSAYRNLVKQYHPDVNRDQNENRIRQLNEAYDILSDPKRKASYDRGPVFTSFTPEHQEAPEELYRREYLARKREKDRQKRDEDARKILRFEAGMKVFYRYVWILAFPVLVFSLLLVIDRYLPQLEYREVAESGWQKKTGRRYHKRHRSKGYLVSYMKTKNFIIAVPDEMHVDYDYYAADRKVLTISVSPIFKIPSTVSLAGHPPADVERTIFSNQFKIHYLLFISSLFIVFRKRYSPLNFCVSVMLPILLIAVLLIMF